jgi:MerR family transcriptional regulator/heat shock protein HspR
MVRILFDEEKSLYTIGTISNIIDEHPETLRVWEKNGLIKPNRTEYQRKYSNNDIKRLKFIKYLLDEKGLNIAGVKHLISMYPCWFKRNCNGGKSKNNSNVNESKRCWKLENTFCFIANDKADICNSCDVVKKCPECKNIE